MPGHSGHPTPIGPHFITPHFHQSGPRNSSLREIYLEIPNVFLPSLSHIRTNGQKIEGFLTSRQIRIREESRIKESPVSRLYTLGLFGPRRAVPYKIYEAQLGNGGLHFTIIGIWDIGAVHDPNSRHIFSKPKVTLARGVLCFPLVSVHLMPHRIVVRIVMRDRHDCPQSRPQVTK